jgi:hypothetical protein
MTDHTRGNHDASGGGGSGRWVLWGFVLVAAYFLITEHRAHLAQYWPLLLVLACPLMHLFHGHGEHRHQASDAKDAGKAQSEKKHGGGCH